MAGPGPSDLSIRAATGDDAQALVGIYNHYVVTTIVTFEETPISAEVMAGRIEEATSSGLPWLVAESPLGLVGYAYASPWKSRSAYRNTVEITVYVAPDHGRRGIGEALYRELFTHLRQCGVRALLSGIALPNDASVALHEKLGMEKVAHLREVGFKLGRWIDVGYWQCLLDTEAAGDAAP